ncbi:Abi family protein [Shewanella baltica]|uniref:Abi-like protein n=1 Tax=Shewanella baltica (strain OS155 / ATCC BAA-1091) TaxID=325240 RepID=A3DB40_SHEB5|nr:Abi family protein [Shewanella baltica]ABN63953.1 protein of unknown function DUF1526 [Shewanella baltica OS155]AEH16455.1 hypothetical protein Sbal117_4835 [Shewanella baltica OS117]
MPHKAIEQTLSFSRFATYRNAVVAHTGEDCVYTALNLYEWNAKLAAGFFVPLHIYEVTLRNAISDAISQRYGVDWPTNDYFLNSLTSKNKRAITSLYRDHGYQGVGKILPEVKLFFWEEMLTKRHDGRIWRPYVNTVFPNTAHLSVEQIRTQLKDACFTIRKLRNRIAHHEPIFNQATLPDIYSLIASTIAMRCNETHEWLNQLETVNELLSNKVI